MKPAVPSAPVAAKRVVVQVQRFRDNAPLDRVIHRRQLERRPAARRLVHVTIRIQSLIIAPARRTMVNDDVAHRTARQRALPLKNARVTPAETHIPNYHIVGIVHHALTRNADAVARGTLSRHRHIRRLNKNRHLQVNDTRHVEHHRARTRRFQRLAQRARPAVFQTRHHINFPAASAIAELAPAFRARKRRHRRLRQIIRLRRPRNEGLALFRPFVQRRLDGLQHVLLVLFPLFLHLLFRLGHGQPFFPRECRRGRRHARQQQSCRDEVFSVVKLHVIQFFAASEYSPTRELRYFSRFV